MKRFFTYILAVMLLCGACLSPVKGEETVEEAVTTVRTEQQEEQQEEQPEEQQEEQLEEEIPQETQEGQIPEESLPETAVPDTAQEPEEEATEPETAEPTPSDENAAADEAQCGESPAEQISNIEIVTEETSAEEYRTEEAPAEDSLTEENTQEESPIGETTAEESPVQDTQSEKTSADEASGEKEQIPVVLNLRPDGEVQKTDDIWQITVSDETEILAFIWEDTSAGQYRIRVTDTEEKTCEESILSVPSWETEASRWAAGEIYTLYLAEICENGIPEEDSLLFRITVTEESSEADSDPETTEQTETEATEAETVGTAGTGRRRKNTDTLMVIDTAGESASETETAAVTDETTETAATETAVAGTAKKSKIAGTKKAAAARRTPAKKAASAVKKSNAVITVQTEENRPLTLDTIPDSPVSRLTAGGEALNILLNEGEGLFTASLTEENALNLIPAEAAVEWQAEVSSLETLKNCGITSLSFTFGDQVYRMNLTEETAAETETEKVQEMAEGSDGSLPEELTWCLNENGLTLKWEEQAITWNIAAADTHESDKHPVQ